MDGMKILTLSGWTQPPDALLELTPNAHTFDYIDHTPQSILQHKGRYDAVIGWSLGGVLARQLIKEGAIQANALIMIATPYQFVRNEHMHEAMPPDTFDQFYANFRDDSKRTSSRFHGLLVKGDTNAKLAGARLSYHERLHDTQRWLQWLDYLYSYSADHHDYSELPKTLIIHGAQDAVVPLEQGKRLSEKLNAKLAILPDAGHAPHAHDAGKVRSLIEEFLA